MKLQLHLSLCSHDKKLKDVCSNILHKVSTGILDKTIKAPEQEIRTLKTKRINNCNNIKNKTTRENCNNIKNKTTRENYKLIKKVLAEKVVILELKIKSRPVQKISHNSIQPTSSVCARNRRLKKDVILNKRKEKRKRY